MERRGVTPIVGFVLLVGIVAIGAMSLFVAGMALADATQSSAEQQQLERSMTQMAETADELAAGTSNDRSFAIQGSDGADAVLDEDAGNVRIVLEHNGTTEILDDDLGALVYERSDGTEVAYQGGGVWRKDDGGASMVRSPDFQYRADINDEATLTFPLVRMEGSLDGAPQTRGELTVEEQNQLYPTETEGNPLEGGEVFVEIESEYCEAWESHLEDRTDASVAERCSGAGTYTDVGELRFELVVPPKNVLGPNQAVFAPGEIDGGGKKSAIHGDVLVHDNTSVSSGNVDGDIERDNSTRMPDRHSDVEALVDECTNVHGWEEFDEKHTTEPGLHCVKSLDNQDLRSVEPEKSAEAVFKPDKGRMRIVVRDTFDPQGDVIVEDGDKVQFYSPSSQVKLQSNYEFGNPSNPEQTELIVAHDLRVSGQVELNAIIYTTNGEFDGGGGSTVHGAILAEEVNLKGGEEIYPAHSGQSIGLESDDDTRRAIYYLHVSETVMSVDEN